MQAREAAAAAEANRQAMASRSAAKAVRAEQLAVQRERLIDEMRIIRQQMQMQVGGGRCRCRCRCRRRCLQLVQGHTYPH